MTNPDYKIQELFDVDRMCRYYVVLKRAYIPMDIDDYRTIKKFDELEKAKECVRQLRKYKQPVYHLLKQFIIRDIVRDFVKGTMLVGIIVVNFVIDR